MGYEELVVPSIADDYVGKATEEAEDLLEYFEYDVSFAPTKKFVKANDDAKLALNTILRHHDNWCESRHCVEIRTTVDGVFDPTEADRFRYWLRNLTTQAPLHILACIDGLNYTFAKALGARNEIWGTEQFASEEVVENANELAELFGIKPTFRVGQKQSRIINTLCKAIGVDKVNYNSTIQWLDDNGDIHQRIKAAGYNALFAAMADSYNLSTRERRVTISTDVVDFLMQSIGTSWASCMTIDKNDVMDTDDHMHHYDGMYSGGVLSYALDNVSFVVTYVPPSYEGNEPQLVQKEHRCLFFFDPDTGRLGQSRVYPDGRDNGEPNIAKEMRQIVQKVIADALDVPNLWTTEKGNDVFHTNIIAEGVQYHDYFRYNDVSMSFLKMETETKKEEMPKFKIGTSNQICPGCGDTFEREDAPLCYCCYGNGAKCAWCGRAINTDDNGYYYEYDNSWYCSNECAEEHCLCVPADRSDVVHQDDCSWCEADGNWYYYNEEGAETTDGHWFPNRYVADNYDYVYCEDVEQYAPRDDCRKDDYSGDWYYETEGIEIEYNWYANEDNAWDDGWRQCVDDDEWHMEHDCYGTTDNVWYASLENALKDGYVVCIDTGRLMHYSKAHFNFAKRDWQQARWSVIDRKEVV